MQEHRTHFLLYINLATALDKHRAAGQGALTWLSSEDTSLWNVTGAAAPLSKQDIAGLPPRGIDSLRMVRGGHGKSWLEDTLECSRMTLSWCCRLGRRKTHARLQSVKEWFTGKTNSAGQDGLSSWAFQRVPFSQARPSFWFWSPATTVIYIKVNIFSTGTGTLTADCSSDSQSFLLIFSEEKKCEWKKFPLRNIISSHKMSHFPHFFSPSAKCHKDKTTAPP